MSVEAYRLSDNSTQVWVKADNAFRVVAWRVVNYTQVTLAGEVSHTGTAPSGTKVFDSANRALYIPLMGLNPVFTTLYSGNADGQTPPSVNLAGLG